MNKPAVKYTFQQRVMTWLLACFPMEHIFNREVRNKHFLEESLELTQSLGLTREEAHALVDYVFDRPAGVPFQEVGGTMVTLAALCQANELNMEEAGEAELARINLDIDKIRNKQKHKPH